MRKTCVFVPAHRFVIARHERPKQSRWNIRLVAFFRDCFVAGLLAMTGAFGKSGGQVRAFIGIFLVVVGFMGCSRIDHEQSDVNEISDRPSETLSPTLAASLPPTAFIRGVPFTTQAPFAHWDAVHEETCEEASLLMVHEYLNGNRSERIPPQDAENALQDLISWEKKYFGFFEDTNSAQMIEIAKLFYQHTDSEVQYNFSEQDIKREISAGNPVIIPAAGQMLKNPYFKQPGPIYHAIVIIGYTETDFITNDPGTKKGMGYVYPINRIMTAAHEWTGDPDTIAEGKAAMIIVK